MAAFGHDTSDAGEVLTRRSGDQDSRRRTLAALPQLEGSYGIVGLEPPEVAGIVQLCTTVVHGDIHGPFRRATDGEADHALPAQGAPGLATDARAAEQPRERRARADVHTRRRRRGAAGQQAGRDEQQVVGPERVDRGADLGQQPAHVEAAAAQQTFDVGGVDGMAHDAAGGQIDLEDMRHEDARSLVVVGSAGRRGHRSRTPRSGARHDR